ncbi:MAG: hypothetical protein JSU68_04995 [Phycisphaerales bacterium]|nr:MAG: hypothetical protein JSU68_04995 [Phycisphaerales bacterium]
MLRHCALGAAYTRQYELARGAIFNTIESYNGRALDGLGTLYEHGQVADFISAGGTFGIGHVWEPLAAEARPGMARYGALTVP